MNDLIIKGRAMIEHAIKPLIGSLIAVAFTTTMLLFVDAEFHPRHIAIAYLLPVTMIT